jgi:predicted nucleic acid-binding protein
MSLPSSSPYHLIFEKLIEGEFDLAVNHEILLEYEEILTEKFGDGTSFYFMRLLNELPNIHFINIYYRWHLIEQDPDDNKYVDTYLAGKGSYIVTEDKHFKILQKNSFPVVQVCGINAFISLLKKEHK